MSKYNIQNLFETLIEKDYALDSDVNNWLDTVINFSESNKGVLTVVITGISI